MLGMNNRERNMTQKDNDGKNTFIDLFCGCGGLALGFQQAGFKSVFAVDNDPASAKTYEHNFKHPVFLGDIKDLDDLPVKSDLIIGSPPCQGFSTLGKFYPKEEHENMNKLWKHYLRILDIVEPKGFVVENVPQFIKSQEYEYFADELNKRDYNFSTAVLNAVNYGVPQKRKRGFIIGMKDHIPAFPAPLKKLVTVKESIGDLPLIPTEYNWHISRNPTTKSIDRYKCVPPGGNRFDLMNTRPDITPKCWLDKPTGSTDVFGRLEWESQALTIRTEFFKPEKGRYLHPEADRPITHREAARLQTFPDDFIFIGSKIEVARMIGNAVPPNLAKYIGRAVKKVLFNNNK